MKFSMCWVAFNGFVLQGMCDSFLKHYRLFSNILNIYCHEFSKHRWCVKEKQIMCFTSLFHSHAERQRVAVPHSFLSGTVMSTLSNLFTDWKLTISLKTAKSIEELWKFSLCQVFQGVLAGFFRYRLVEFYWTVFLWSIVTSLHCKSWIGWWLSGSECFVCWKRREFNDANGKE